MILIYISTGKTTAINILRELLTSLHYQVYVVPEVPTLVFSCGASYPGEEPSKRDELIALESSLLNLQVQFENSMRRIAMSTMKPSIIICDRGVLDIKAYMSPDIWEEVSRAAGEFSYHYLIISQRNMIL